MNKKVISNQEVIKQAVEVLEIEARGILGLINNIDGSFAKMVDLIYLSKGRLVISGIGKSGIIGRKISATLNSTGTRSLFLHPVEAVHGDLGMVCRDDIFLAISNSGETEELNMLLPTIKEIGCKIIAFTGNKNSALAKSSDIVICTLVEKEACPLGLAPTASTSAQMAMGDALSVVLINKKNFCTTDFRKNHPGGLLGHRLAKQVKDIMFTGDMMPNVGENAFMEEAIKEMNRLALGAVLIIKSDNCLAGIITDGDLRRYIAQDIPIKGKKAADFMTVNPIKINYTMPASDALDIMEKHQITVLPITDDNSKVKGILHLHDILGKGEFKFNPS